MKVTMLCGALALAFALSACGKDSSSNNNNNNASLTIKGTVSYSGSETGSLYVAIQTKEHPCCPQDSGAGFKMFNAPVFPIAYLITNLPAGTYYVDAFFDINADGGFPPCPTSTDVCGKTTTPVELSEANPTITQDVTLDIVGCQAGTPCDP